MLGTEHLSFLLILTRSVHTSCSHVNKGLIIKDYLRRGKDFGFINLRETNFFSLS